MPKYTNVRMNADSKEAKWWLHQSDREFAMQILVQIANRKYGENADLIKISRQRMIEGPDVNNIVEQPMIKNPAPQEGIIGRTNEYHNKVTLSTTEEPAEEKTAPAKPTPKPKPESQPEAQKPTEAVTDNNDDDDAINDALFGDDTASEPKETHQSSGNSFRDKL